MSWSYANLFQLSGSGSSYYSSGMNVPNVTLYDTKDGTDNGYVANGGLVDLVTGGTHYTFTVIGTTANGVVLLYSATGSKWLATSTFYSGGTTVSGFDNAGSLCFLEGTKIATPQGEVAVETLKIGDKVLTKEGGESEIKWMGYQTIQNRIGTRADQAPVKISANAIAPGIPHSDLYVTGGHAVMVEGTLVNASVLCNGDTIEYVPLNEMPSTYTYWHIETEAHEIILANGMEAETFLDAPDRSTFDNYTQYVDRYGTDRRIEEMPHYRVTSTRHLPKELKERLGITDGAETDWAGLIQNSGSTISLKQAC